jgi:hypothetical protein
MAVPAHWIEQTNRNKRLGIPVAWRPAQKVAYRAGRGMYCYSRRSTHFHVLLLEGIKVGRLDKKPGEFLCGAQITDLQIHEAINIANAPTQWPMRDEVTCPDCLARAKRLRQQRLK